MPGLTGQRDMESDDVGLAKNGLFIRPNASVLIRECIIGDQIICKDAYWIEGLQMPNDQTTDSSNADHSDGQTTQTSSNPPIPHTVPHAMVRAHRTSQKCKHLPDCEFCDGRRWR